MEEPREESKDATVTNNSEGIFEREVLAGETGELWNSLNDTWNTRSSSKTGMNLRCHSAPLMHVGASTQPVSWYTSKGSESPARTRSTWRPLASTWRAWNEEHMRSDVSDGTDYVHGCVPAWGKQSFVRQRGILEHELTWAYYRMRKHEKHPQRKEVGEVLPDSAVSAKMRFGQQTVFQFWRDLRPPFIVVEVRRVDDGREEPRSTISERKTPIPHPDEPPTWDQGAMPHPDGELYYVSYECAIEYMAERLFDLKRDCSTFDSKIRGVAQVRMPNTYPNKGVLSIVSWGQPTLNSQPDADKHLRSVPESEWMPIASELNIDPRSDRMASCRSLTKQADRKLARRMVGGMAGGSKMRQVQVGELQSLLMGPHASLPRLAKMERDAKEKEQRLAMATPGSKVREPKQRRHTIFTPAAGFVSYSG